MPIDDQYVQGVLRVVEGTVSGPSELTFHFNPGEYAISKSASWSRPQVRGGKDTGRPEFQGANPQTLQFETLFDEMSASGAPVAAAVNTLIEWVKPTDDSIQRQRPQPPIVVFEWGDNPAITSFRGYLKQVSVRYLLFDGTGKPLRATANIQLEEVPVEQARQNPTSGAIHGRRTHTMAEGETLASVAWREYENAALWRGLADFNGIDDPLRIAPGTVLLVPTYTEAKRRS
ncbi:MAG: CIS tube protein [Candidatus Limnocylindrales bacterium]